MIIMITITAGLSGQKIQESKLDLLKGLALYVVGYTTTIDSY